MARKTKSPAQIKSEMAKLEQELKQAEQREAERIGALAIKADLHMAPVTDSELLAALKNLAATFPTQSDYPIKTA